MYAIFASIPPAVKTLAVIGAVYSLLQAAKKIQFLSKYLTGWVAIGVNIALAICGELLAVPANQLYSANTLNVLIGVLTVSLSAAGIHGTVKSLSAPTVLATMPGSQGAKQVPAIVLPVDPEAIPVEKTVVRKKP